MRTTIRLSFVPILLAITALAVARFQVTSEDAYPVYLLSFPSLQQELRLSKAAAKKIDQINVDFAKKHLGQVAIEHGPNPKPVMTIQQAREDSLRMQRALLALLNPKQKARLREVGYQYRGAFSFSSPELSKALGITEDQQKKLRAAAGKRQKNYQAAFAAAVKNGGHLVGSTPKATSAALAQARLAMTNGFNADASKILTPKQRAQWRQMNGKPFPIITLYEPLKPPTR